MRKILIILFTLVLTFNIIIAQSDRFVPSQPEIEEMNKAILADSNLSKLFSWFGEPESLYSDYKRNLHQADSIWQADQNTLKFLDIGVTEKFEFIPLVDWFTANDSLIGESGVSYLIRTDEATILFDLGLNSENVHPSPVLHNMAQLGISIEDIDIIVISHNHDDHIGGSKWTENNTFSITNHQLNLDDIPVYTPNEMTYPGLSPKYTPKPTRISKGVATIGVIHKPVFVIDIAEQAIAVNVKDRGIVVISGCGHQSIKNILERTDILFKEPIYGILGGFHYPIEENRNITWLYKYILVDKLPWERLTMNDIDYNINLLKDKGVRLVGISGHDSCDKSIELFKKEFGKNYQDIVVGQKITLNN